MVSQIEFKGLSSDAVPRGLRHELPLRGKHQHDNAGVADGVSGNGSYADVIGNPHATPCPVPYPGTPGPQLYNSCSYEQPQGLTFSDSGRNSLVPPYRTNFYMSVYKVFKPTEKINVQFRVEAFNIFNHTQWRGVNNSVGTANFMFPAYAHMPRVLQFAIRITF